MARSRKSLRESNQRTLGLIGLAGAAVLVFSALNVNAIKGVLGESSFSAEFADAGGARSGDDVRVDGLTVGSVSSVKLDGATVTIDFRASGIRMGDQTRVEVKSDNALGSKYLAVDPRGSGNESKIPKSRTDPGYAVSEVLGRLTATTEQIDTSRLAESFTSLSKVLDATPEEFSSALTGVSALSKTISTRDAELQELLRHANSVSGVLADRNKQVTTILAEGSKIFKEIYSQREQIERLFGQVNRAVTQITLLAKENEKTLGPDLRELEQLAKTLGKYRENIGYVLDTLPKYVRSLGEAVGSGPFFQAYIGNLFAPETVLNTDNAIKSLLDPSFNGAK